MRAARRSERFPSLIRIDTINGRPAEEVAEGTRFEELAVAWPAEKLDLSGGDATVDAISRLAPFGKGSRVVIAGPSRSGKSEALRRLASALSAVAGLEVSAVLAGVRPEEIADFPVAPGSALTFSASVDAQAQAVEQAVEVGRRVAARGGDAVVLIDGFEYLPASAARRALAAGRNLAGAGSLTVIATAPAPIGGETTVVVLDRAGHVPGAGGGRVRHAAPGAAPRRSAGRGRAGAGAGRGRAGRGGRGAGGEGQAGRPRPQARRRSRRAGRRQDPAGLRRGEEARRQGQAEAARRKKPAGGEEAARRPRSRPRPAKKPAAAAKKPAATASRRRQEPPPKKPAAAKKPRRQAQAGRQEARRRLVANSSAPAAVRRRRGVAQKRRGP